MPKRALIERRPWLLAGVAAAMVYLLALDSPIPELYLLLLKGAALAMLGAYALLRHHGGDARVLAGVMVLAAFGAMAIDLFFEVAVWIFVVGNGLAIALFQRHPRAHPTPSQKAAAAALLLGAPLIAWLLPADRAMAAVYAIHALSAGAMAGAAWMSSFPRYRVGTGAVLVVGAGLLGIAQTGPLPDSRLLLQLGWGLYFTGQFLICTAVTQSLRLRNVT